MNLHIPFTKTHSLGNDFIIIDTRDFDHDFSLTRQEACDIAARDNPITGGCDQIPIIRHTDDDASDIVRLQIFNADGSEVGACYNGTRVVGALTKAAQIETAAGVIEICASEMPNYLGMRAILPRFDWQSIPLASDNDTESLTLHDDLPPAFLVNVGNPHAIMFFDGGDDLDALALKYGRKLEQHRLFPEHANIGFAHIIGAGEVNYRTWERGAGLTKACGSGAAATAIAYHHRYHHKGRVRLNAPHGAIFVNYQSGANPELIVEGPTPSPAEITHGVLGDMLLSAAQ